MFWCASRPVIQAFVFFLLCVAPHPVLGFLTGLCTVGFDGRNHYICWISGGQGREMGAETEGYSRFLPLQVRGAKAEGGSRLSPPKVRGARTGGHSRLSPSKVWGVRTEGHSRLPPLKVWRVEPEGYSNLHLLDRSASGIKRFPLCREVRMMDGPGRRQPLAHTERLLRDVKIGPPRGPRTRWPCRPPYGILWTL